MRFLAGAIVVMLLLGAAQADPAADKPVPKSDEEAIAMAKQECAAALAVYGPDAEKLEWHVSRHDGRWFVGAQRDAHYFMAIFPKFRPCISGLQTF